jgi:hypothetical protein
MNQPFTIKVLEQVKKLKLSNYKLKLGNRNAIILSEKRP